MATRCAGDWGWAGEQVLGDCGEPCPPQQNQQWGEIISGGWRREQKTEIKQEYQTIPNKKTFHLLSNKVSFKRKACPFYDTPPSTHPLTTLLPPCRPDAQIDQVILQTAAHNPSDQMVLCHMKFFFFLFFSPKVSCKSAISYISPVLPCSLPVIKGHIILLSCRQKDGKGLQVDWTILHLTRATTADASFVPRSVQFVGSNTLFRGYNGLFSHGND